MKKAGIKGLNIRKPKSLRKIGFGGKNFVFPVKVAYRNSTSK